MLTITYDHQIDTHHVVNLSDSNYKLRKTQIAAIMKSNELYQLHDLMQGSR